MPRVQMKARKPSALHRSQQDSRPSINPLKKRIRDLRRVLERKDDLPADVRIGHERELASCQHEVAASQRKIERSRMIKKYHMVRFFERKNATKLLKRARKALDDAGTPQEKETARLEIHDREVDLNYTLYCPLHLSYSSLYANSKKETGTASAAKPKRDMEMWKVVERAMGTGRLQQLRDGKLEGYTEDSEPKPSAPSAKRPKNAAPVKDQSKTESAQDGDEPAEESDEDGQGFFE